MRNRRRWPKRPRLWRRRTRLQRNISVCATRARQFWVAESGGTVALLANASLAITSAVVFGRGRGKNKFSWDSTPIEIMTIIWECPRSSDSMLMAKKAGVEQNSSNQKLAESNLRLESRSGQQGRSEFEGFRDTGVQWYETFIKLI